MKNIFLLIIFILSDICAAQKIILNNPNNNTLLLDLENPIDFLSDTIDCNEIRFEAKNAELYIIDNCKLLVEPKSKDIVTIHTYFKDKLIDKKVYLVDTIKPELELICPYTNGKPNYNLSERLTINLDKYSISIPLKIVQYEMIIISKNNILLRNIYNSRIFNEEQKKIISTLKSGDFIILKDIHIESSVNSNSSFDPINFKIFEI